MRSIPTPCVIDTNVPIVANGDSNHASDDLMEKCIDVLMEITTGGGLVMAMQDDVYLLVQEGWKAVLDGKPNTDLIPPPLIIRRYFAEEQAAIEQLEAERDAITLRLEELDEEHGGEDGLLADARTDKGKLTKATVKARLVDINTDAEAADERKVLKECLDLIEDEAAASKKLKDAQKAARCPSGREIPEAHRGGDSGARRGRQMAGCPCGRCAK